MRSALLRVDYRTPRPLIDITKRGFDDATLVTAVNLTKHRGWSYEKEWRALGKKCGEYDFPPAALVGIIFGCRTAPDDKQRMKHAVESRWPRIKLYEAKERKGAFAIDIRPC